MLGIDRYGAHCLPRWWLELDWPAKLLERIWQYKRLPKLQRHCLRRGPGSTLGRRWLALDKFQAIRPARSRLPAASKQSVSDAAILGASTSGDDPTRCALL
jgi:hypothetical protein